MINSTMAYCTISLNSSGIVTRDSPDENIISSSCLTERDLSNFFVKHLEFLFYLVGMLELKFLGCYN